MGILWYHFFWGVTKTGGVVRVSSAILLLVCFWSITHCMTTQINQQFYSTDEMRLAVGRARNMNTGDDPRPGVLQLASS
jgi:hypothetical protein